MRRGLISFLLKLIGFGDYDIFQIDSTIIVNDQYNFFLGFIASGLIGTVMGMLFYLIQEWIGYQYILVGRMILALFFWFLFKIYSSAFLMGKSLEQRTLITYYNHVASTVCSGLFLGWSMKRLLQTKK
jgi:membrane associated rhomboid family serine protease